MKDYLQRRYLEQISEHQTRKDTFLKCRSDDLNYGSFKRQQSSSLVQSFEYISKDPRDHSPLHSSATHKSNRTVVGGGGGKACSFDSSSVHLQHSVSDTNLCCGLSASDKNFPQSQSSQIIRSPSKRGLLQRGATIDMEDAPGSNIDDEQMTSSPTSPTADEKTDVAGKITFSIDRPDDDDDDDDETNSRGAALELKSPLIPASLQCERKSRPFRHSHSDQPSSDSFGKGGSNQFLGPYRHSFEHHHHDNRTLPVPLTGMPYHPGVPIPVAPYSASSDPGPYQSPWSHTPTNPYGLMNFHFPKSQEGLAASAQGSIAQLSSLTKILCDEPSVFTPITPR